MQSTSFLRLTVGVCCLALQGFSLNTQAQSAGASSGAVLEEIVVTARKRDENLQDVPVSVSAFTERDLDDIGLRSMRDYAKQVPNFFMVETQNSTFAFPNIRGITQARNLDPAIAVVVDGVLATNPIAMSQELFDVEQIEVYKGPQGALYGRNAMGGAINITTKKPSNNLEGMLRVGGANGGTSRAQASISGPLVEDTLYARAAISYYDTDGLRDNTGVKGAHGDRNENRSARARIVWEASDDFTLDFRASYSKDESAALGFIDVSPIWHESAPGSGISFGCALGIFPAPAPPCNAGVVTGGNIADLFVPGQSPFVGSPNITGEDIPLQTNLNGIEEREISSASILINWDLPIGTLTSVTSWDKSEDFAIGENPPRTVGRGQKNTQYKTSEALSQEIRLTSASDQRLRWIGGFYLVQTDAWLSTTVQRDFDGIDSLTDLVKKDPLNTQSGRCMNPAGTGPGSPFFPPDGSNDNQGNCLMGYDGDAGDNFAWALFAQVNYDLTDTLELSVSARFDRDEREQTVRTPQELFPALPPGAPPFTVREGDVRERNFDSLQPKITLRWSPRDNLMTYLTYAEGFRSGGFNRPGIGVLAKAGLPGPPVPLGVEDSYDQQDTASIEVGVKFTAPNGRFLVNAAAFHTEVDNYQTFAVVTVASILSQIIIPVDEVEIDGFEIDATWLATDSLTFNIGYGVLDSEITSDPLRGFKGNKAPMTPDDSFNAGLSYRQPFTLAGNEASVFLRVDYRRTGEVFFLPGNFAKRDDIDFVDVRLGLEFGQGWRIEGFAKNATDEDYCGSFFTANGFCFPGKLRETGVEVTKRFGQ